MRTTVMNVPLAMSLLVGPAVAKDQPAQGPHRKDHEPPPQAYEDCKGKKAGDIVQHTTREGKVPATCMDSPKGLVARPNRPKGKTQNGEPKQTPAPKEPSSPDGESR